LREAIGAWVDCGGFRELSARRSAVAEFRAPQWVALAKQMDFKWSVRRCSSAATAACHAAAAVVTATHITVQRCCIASQPNHPPIIALQRLPASARRAASSSGGPQRGLRECCAERAAFRCADRWRVRSLPQLGMPRAMFVALAEDEAELEPICAHLCGSAVSLFKRE
jgi:hypothetical protein